MRLSVVRFYAAVNHSDGPMTAASVTCVRTTTMSDAKLINCRVAYVV